MPNHALQFKSCRIEKRGVKDYLDILDKGEFDAEIDPFSFWNEKSGRFSNVSGIALQYLAMPATSASTERLFSCSGLSCKGKKKRVISFTGIANALQI